MTHITWIYTKLAIQSFNQFQFSKRTSNSQQQNNFLKHKKYHPTIATTLSNNASCQLTKNKLNGLHSSFFQNDRWLLATFYAQSLIEKVLCGPQLNQTNFALYAKELLQKQNHKNTNYSSSTIKRALIISENDLEQNVFSTLLRGLHVLPVQIKNKATLLKHINQNFNIVIISDKFNEVGIFAITQMCRTMNKNQSLAVMISETDSAEYEKLDFDVLLQHPFSIEKFSDVLKIFLQTN